MTDVKVFGLVESFGVGAYVRPTRHKEKHLDSDKKKKKGVGLTGMTEVNIIKVTYLSSTT